jgi:hypothetical protein
MTNPAKKLTPLEVADSVTGFDEMSVSQHFGKPLSDLQLTDASMWGRALVFVLKRREGLDDDDARNAALGMTIKDISDSFGDDSDDDYESGKDESADSSQPETSPSSVS